MAMLTIANVQEYLPQILEYGIQDFDDYFAKSTADIRRKLNIEWWQIRTSRINDISKLSGSSNEFDNTKLNDSQFTRCAVYHCLAYYILPALTTWNSDGDKFREMMTHFREKFEEEFDLILRKGVEYDDDGDSTYESSEKYTVNFGRLVR